MITVSIFINGTPIFTRTAVNRGLTLKKTSSTLCRYALDDGTFVLHERGKNAVPLAIKMLKTIKEQR